MNSTETYLSSRSQEEKILARHALDKAAIAEKSCKTTYTKFLTPAEKAFLQQFLQRLGIRPVFDGGRTETERAVAMFIPPWFDPEAPDDWLEEESPVCCLKFENTGDAELSHRDYLGALMAAGIRRDTVGDIDVHGTVAYVFCLREIAGYIAGNLESAGRAKLKISRISRDEVPAAVEDDGEELYGTVQSLRLDAVIAEGFALSRDDAKALIIRGDCSVDHIPCEKPDSPVSEGALISVRGKGRLRFLRVRGETRRGRIGIELKRYGKKH